MIDASKRYDGSASGGREIAWVIQKIDLDLEKFARHFYEPGLLLHYVGAAADRVRLGGPSRGRSRPRRPSAR